MDIERPFDALNNNKGKEITVELKNSEVYTGTLAAFDIHLNLTLANAKLDSKEVGNMIIRGDMVVTIKNLQ